jgi:hypothetical protein
MNDSRLASNSLTFGVVCLNHGASMVVGEPHWLLGCLTRPPRVEQIPCLRRLRRLTRE